MNLSAQEYLAKLLAKENLTVQHGNYHTASFDVINRVLRLPLWADKGKDVYDLLVGHEVGHALFTPADGWHDADVTIPDVPKAYLNIVEDIRIERKIQESYPGIVRRFKAGYKVLFDDNLFGTDDRDINAAGLMDRLNVSSKGRGYVPVDFSDDEAPLIKEAMEVQTWDDVVIVCQKLYDFIEQQKEEQEQEEQEEMAMPTPSAGSRESDSEEGEDPMDGDQLPSGGDKSSDKTKSDTPPAAPEAKAEEETAEDVHETWTEDTFRDSEEQLLETTVDQWGESSQARFSSGVSDINIKKMIYTYKDAVALRATQIAGLSDLDTKYSPYTSPECKADWKETKSTYKSQANLIAKDFERKKAAFEYLRATTSKSGKLDPLKMHQYKYSEDIFLSTTQLAQAKSHGIMMFLDLSGSMCDIIGDVVAQTITIAMFCRQVGIPFEAYSFTTTSHWMGQTQSDRVMAPSELESEYVKVVEIFSSKMNKKTFDEAAYTVFALGKAHAMRIRNGGYSIYAHELHAVDQMGSTPLVQTCFAAAKLTKAFIRKHAIQNTNIMMLTDGQPDGLGIHEDRSATLGAHRHNKSINFEGKMITGTNARTIYAKMLLRLKEITGSTVMGFHLASCAATFGQGYHGIEENKTFPNVITAWRKESFSEWKNEKGYDNYFIIKINKAARFDSDEFDPKKAHTINDIKREFRKFNKTKKGNKQLVARITDAVAA